MSEERPSTFVHEVNGKLVREDKDDEAQ